LQRRTHERHAAKRGSGKAADAVLVVPVDEGNRAAVVQALMRRHEAGDARTDDQDVAGLARQYVLLRLFLVRRLSRL
jgi:hypothetical protein